MNKIDCLKAMKIQVWKSRHEQNLNSAESDDWRKLQMEVRACEQCVLHETRTQVVFGVGNPKSAIMLVGEGPGATEDEEGIPFVGRAGQLLDAMLAAISLDRTQVYMANIVKCRPPENRNPTKEEIASCTPFLIQQIKLMKPRLIVALGKVAAQFLLACDEELIRLRSKKHVLKIASLSEIPVIVTYHPAYLLRAPLDKAKAWEDLKLIKAHLSQ